MTTRQIVRFFVKYKYQAIFPVAVLEGPIITIISGFLVSRGILSLLPALLVVFLGDFISDTAFYFLGKGGRQAIKYLKFIRISEEKMEQLENRFKSSPWKTMILAKVSYGLGTIFMIASGASRMKVKNFFEYISPLDFIRSSLLLSAGYFFGRLAVRFGTKYFGYYVAAVIILVPFGYWLFRRKTPCPF
jgi:membrane protein DedA with SNARE-associated domain